MTATWNKVWTRAQWQKKRDALKVKKGATKISMGGALDKFHKSAAVGAAKGLQALPELKKAVAAYQQQIAPKSSQLAAAIERDLEYYIKQYEKDAPGFASLPRDYTVSRAAAFRHMQGIGAELIAWEKAGSNGAFGPTEGKPAGAALQAFQKAFNRAVYNDDKLGDVQKDWGPLIRACQAASDQKWTKGVVDALLLWLPKTPAKV